MHMNMNYYIKEEHTNMFSCCKSKVFGTLPLGFGIKP